MTLPKGYGDNGGNKGGKRNRNATKAIIGVTIPLVVVGILVWHMTTVTGPALVKSQEKLNEANEAVDSAAWDLAQACVNEPSAACDEYMTNLVESCNNGEMNVCNDPNFTAKLVAYGQYRGWLDTVGSKSKEQILYEEQCVDMGPGGCVPSEYLSENIFGSGPDEGKETQLERYAAGDVGFIVDIPDGWTGTQLNNEIRLIVTEKNVPLTPLPDSWMSITMYSENDLAEMATTDSGDNDDCNTTFIGYVPLTVRSSLYSLEEAELRGDTVQATARQVVRECGGDKVNIYAVATSDHLISLAYHAKVSVYDQNLEDFEAFLGSIIMEYPSPTKDFLRNAQGKTPSAHVVESGGERLVLSTWTASAISGLTFDEENKRVSFTIDHESGPASVAINVGRVLEGPYIVTVDGKIVEHEVIVDKVHRDGSNWNEVSFLYNKGNHKVIITGT